MTKVQPLDNLAALAKAGVGVLHVCGSLDPMYATQTREAEKRYKELGRLDDRHRASRRRALSAAPKDPKLVIEFIVSRQRPTGASGQLVPKEESQVGIGR